MNTNRQPAGQPIGGQFSASTRAESEVSLARPASVTHYPEAPFTPGEFAPERYGDSVTSVCSNTTGDDGFSAADRDGRLASIAT